MAPPCYIVYFLLWFIQTTYLLAYVAGATGDACEQDHQDANLCSRVAAWLSWQAFPKRLPLVQCSIGRPFREMKKRTG
ncbi:hypothetical protein LZ31DRAFT_557062 [Colletotrichum somersetense]|nr:hypothetical protein LZ31DRAFT_557062 [Colletotrichum somersetense]